MLTKCVQAIVLLQVLIAIVYPDVARHIGTLYSLGYVRPRGEECPVVDHQPATRYRHCYRDGHLRHYDAGHDDGETKRLLLQAMEDRCPVVIKHPFTTHSCMKNLRRLASDPNNKVHRKTATAALFAQGDQWFPRGTKLYVDNAGQRKQEMYPFGDMLRDFDNGDDSSYLSFENSFTTDYGELWGFDLSWLNGYHSSNFISNFNRSFVTTAFHSALWESFGYQCVGTKTWRFMSPEDSLPTVRLFGTGWTHMHNCNNHPLYDPNTNRSAIGTDEVVSEDSLLYFPPYWAHSVHTTKGLSVLLNYRSLDFMSMLRSEPKYWFMTVLSVGLGLTYFRDYDPDETAYFYYTGQRVTHAHHR